MHILVFTRYIYTNNFTVAFGHNHNNNFFLFFSFFLSQKLILLILWERNTICHTPYEVGTRQPNYLKIAKQILVQLEAIRIQNYSNQFWVLIFELMYGNFVRRLADHSTLLVG